MNENKCRVIEITDYLSPSYPQSLEFYTEEERIKALKSYGFEKRENGKWKFDHNTFADFFEKYVEVRLIQNTDDMTIYNFRKGVYEISNAEELIHKVIRKIMNQDLPLWNPSFGTTAYQTVKHNTMKIVADFNLEDHLNLVDGVLDLDTMKLYPHNPKYLCTSQLPFKYSDNREIPLFLKYLDDVTLGDDSMKMVIQEMFAYAMTFSTIAERSWWLIGNGANGKTVAANLIQELCGEGRYSNTSLSALKGSFGLAQLLGKTVNISDENSADVICSDIYKAIVSGSTMEINQKYKPAISAKITAKMILLFNEAPATTDFSYGFERKIIIIPFRRTFAPSERDPMLFDKLKEELPGIFHWALEGLKRLRAQNYQFTYCQACEDALAQYKKEQNPVSVFFETCFRLDEAKQVRKNLVYKTYLAYCQDNSYTPLSCQVFWRNLKFFFAEKRYSFRTKKSRGLEYIVGIYPVYPISH